MVQNDLNKLSEKFKLISTIELKKDWINTYSILNGSKYFSSHGLQNYLVFITTDKYFSFFSDTSKKMIYRKLKDCQKKVLKIHPHQTIILFQSEFMAIHY